MCRPDRLMHHNKPQFGLRIRNSIEIIAGSPTSSFTKTILTKRRLYLCGRTILTKRFIIAIINNEQLKNISHTKHSRHIVDQGVMIIILARINCSLAKKTNQH